MEVDLPLLLPHTEQELLNQNAPIYILPNEILVTIWNRYREGLRLEERKKFLTVSWVSRHWRNVAINTPTLWVDIYINPSCSVGFLEAVLSRSQGCAVDVTVRIDDCEEDERLDNLYHDKVADIWTIVSTHIERWRSLDIEVDESYDGMRMLLWSLRDAYAPQLQYLRLELPDEEDDDDSDNEDEDTPSDRLFSGGVRLLSKVELTGINVRSNLPILTALTSVDLGGIPPSGRPSHLEFRDLLAASPSLTDLSLRGMCIDYAVPRASHSSTIRSDSLRSLSITCEDDDFMLPLFSVFSTPSLDSLTICIDWGALSKFVGTLNIGRSKYPVLSQLIVLGDYFLAQLENHQSLADTRKLIQCLPSIGTLQLWNFASTHILWHLAYDEGRGSSISNEVLWPRLRTLTWHASTISMEFLRDLLTRRKRMGVPITKLRVDISFLSTLDDEDQAFLEDELELWPL